MDFVGDFLGKEIAPNVLIKKLVCLYNYFSFVKKETTAVVNWFHYHEIIYL